MSGHPAGTRRFAWLGLWLALAATLALAWAAMAQLSDLSAREGEARAHLLADDVARQVQHAVALGIPLDRLEGVPALFAQRVEESRDIEALALFDAHGRLLWAYPAQASALSFEAARSGGAGLVAQSPVVLRGSAVARIELLREVEGPAQLLLRWAPLLLCVALATALAAAEAAHFAHACGPRLRQVLLRSIERSVAQGDFSRRLPVLRRSSFDERLPVLGAELRQINEQHVRLSRLIHSLRQTEPDAARRAELDAVMVHAVGADRMAAGDGREALPLPYAALARWLGVLAGWLAWCLVAALALWSAAGAQLGVIGALACVLSPALPAAAIVHALVCLPWRRAGLVAERGAWWQGGLAGALVLGPAWALSMAALLPAAMARLQQGWMPALSLVLALLCLALLAWRPHKEPVDAA